MSDDFLSSLAAQALGTASAVRPRVASRFEPRPAGGALRRGWPEPAELELDTQASAVPAARDARRADLATISPLAGRVMRDIETERSAPMGAPALPRSNPTGAVPEHWERPGGADGVSVSAPRAAGREPAPASPAPATNAAGQSHPAAPEVVPPSAAGGLAPQPAVRPATAVPEVSSTRPRVVPVQTRRAARETPPPQAPADAGPTIQVTIGRVEVRATTSPAAQPTGRPASPIMTLEEYLRRKTERGNP